MMGPHALNVLPVVILIQITEYIVAQHAHLVSIVYLQDIVHASHVKKGLRQMKTIQHAFRYNKQLIQRSIRYNCNGSPIKGICSSRHIDRNV